MINGLFTSVAELQLDNKYLTLESGKEVSIHPTSVLFGSKPDYIVFTELIQTNKTYMHQNTHVHAEWLVEIAPEYFEKHYLKNRR